ncbi:MAG: GntR family transcriptional regulator [Actinomycetes bacterium]
MPRQPIPHPKGRETLTDQVVARLRDAILSGQLAPGTLYSVYRLATDLGVSRTPAREAALRLAEAGMVRFHRNRGFEVVGVSVRDLVDVVQLRLLLEVPAAGQAAQVAEDAQLVTLRTELAAMHAAAGAHEEERFMAHDRALHEAVLVSTGNRLLAGTVGRLRDVTRTLGASTVDRSRSLADIAREHEPLVAAIAAHDPPLAAEAMRAHLMHTGQLLVDQLVATGAAPVGLALGWVGCSIPCGIVD